MHTLGTGGGCSAGSAHLSNQIGRHAQHIGNTLAQPGTSSLSNFVTSPSSFLDKNFLLWRNGWDSLLGQCVVTILTSGLTAT